MGDLHAFELARDLIDEWHDSQVIDISLHGYMRLSEHEYAVYVSRNELPRDFEKRHDE